MVGGFGILFTTFLYVFLYFQLLPISCFSLCLYALLAYIPLSFSLFTNHISSNLKERRILTFHVWPRNIHKERESELLPIYVSLTQLRYAANKHDVQFFFPDPQKRESWCGWSPPLLLLFEHTFLFHTYDAPTGVEMESIIWANERKY